jgi:hypothetical protein
VVQPSMRGSDKPVSPQPPTPEERAARDRMQADPGRWRPPREPLEVVRYMLEVDSDPEQLDALRRSTANLQLYTRPHASVRVAHGEGWSRIEIGEGLIGAGTALVRSRHGDTLFLDPSTRTYLHLAPDQLPAWVDAPLGPVQIDASQESADGARRHRDVRAGDARAALELDPAPQWRAYAAEALSIVLGIDAGREPELARLGEDGFPVAGATWMPGAPADTPTLRWAVRDLRIERVAPETFASPGHWTDLRDREALSRLAPDGGYALDVGAQARWNVAAPLDQGWFDLAGVLHPKPIPPADSSNQDAIGTCIEARFGNGVGLHVAQTALDDVRTLVNQALRRVQSFKGDDGKITLDWLRQVREFSESMGADGDGLYHLLRWAPDPSADWPPLPGDSPDVQARKRVDRFGGLGLLDRLAVRGASRLLASGQHVQLALPPAVLAACNQVVANLTIAAQDRFDQLSIEDRTALREAYVEQRIGWVTADYKEEGKIQELPKGDVFPADLVRYKLFNLGLDVQVHALGTTPSDRGDALQTLWISGPNSISGSLKLFRIEGSALVLRWPGSAYGWFAVAATVGCVFFPLACAALGPYAAVATWLVLDAASVAITLRNPRIDFVISWVPDPTKPSSLVLCPTVQAQIDTSSRAVVYVGVVPDALHYVIGAVLSLGLSFSTEVEEALADEIRDKIQEILRDDAKLVYPPGQGALGQDIDSAGAFPWTPQRLGLGAHYRRPEQPVLPSPWATQVDPLDAALARAAGLDALYRQAFPAPGDDALLQGRPYAAFAWSVNLLNAYLWTRWRERAFDLMLPAEPVGTALAAAIAAAYPHALPHRDRMRLLAASPPRIELTPLTYAGGGRSAQPPPDAPFGDDYARVTFDDVRLCAPLEGSTAVLELTFPATVAADVVLGATHDGALDLFRSPEIAFEILFDLPSVATGPLTTAATRVKDGAPASPLAIGALRAPLAEGMRAMLAARPAAAIDRELADARNVQRYRLGPLALTSVTVPAGGWLYAYLGLPRSPDPRMPPESDPAGWLADPARMPQSRSAARIILRIVDGTS